MTKTIATRQGDMFDAIAYREYGREAFAPELIQANPEHAGTLIFGAGVTLNIPELLLSASPAALPPWRQRNA